MISRSYGNSAGRPTPLQVRQVCFDTTIINCGHDAAAAAAAAAVAALAAAAAANDSVEPILWSVLISAVFLMDAIVVNLVSHRHHCVAR